MRRTQDLITEELEKIGISIDARYSGPHGTDTHIELFGELELLIVLKTFDSPSKSVENLATQIQGILNNEGNYSKVDYSDGRKIFVHSLFRVLDVLRQHLPC